MDDIWFDGKHLNEGNSELRSVLYPGGPFWTHKKLPWDWAISIGENESVVGDTFGVDGEWPEIRSSYSLSAVVYPDALFVFVSVKWMYLLAKIEIQNALISMSKLLAEILSSHTVLLLPDEPSDAWSMIEHLEQGLVFDEALRLLKASCGGGMRAFSEIKDFGNYVELNFDSEGTS